MIAPRPLAAVVVVAVAACGGHPPPPPPGPVIVTAPRASTTPYTLADVGGVMAIALDGDDVYIRTDAGIGRIDRAGGGVRKLARTAQPGSELGITPWFVWWLDDGRVMRADRSSRAVEQVTVPAAKAYQLAATGSDVWITTLGDRPAPSQLLVFAGEAATAHHVADLDIDPPYGLAAADGQVAVSAGAAYSIVRDGTVVAIDPNSGGSTFAVAGQRLVTADVEIQMYPLDFGPPRTVSAMRTLELERPGCGMIVGMASEPYTVEGITALAGGGGRFAIASGETTVDPDDFCEDNYVMLTVNAGSTKVSLLDASGRFEQVAAGEGEIHALAVDARGVVWATPTAVRAVDR